MVERIKLLENKKPRLSQTYTPLSLSHLPQNHRNATYSNGSVRVDWAIEIVAKCSIGHCCWSLSYCYCSCNIPLNAIQEKGTKKRRGNNFFLICCHVSLEIVRKENERKVGRIFFLSIFGRGKTFQILTCCIVDFVVVEVGKVCIHVAAICRRLSSPAARTVEAVVGIVDADLTEVGNKVAAVITLDASVLGRSSV